MRLSTGQKSLQGFKRVKLRKHTFVANKTFFGGLTCYNNKHLPLISAGSVCQLSWKKRIIYPRDSIPNECLKQTEMPFSLLGFPYLEEKSLYFSSTPVVFSLYGIQRSNSLILEPSILWSIIPNPETSPFYSHFCSVFHTPNKF